MRNVSQRRAIVRTVTSSRRVRIIYYIIPTLMSYRSGIRLLVRGQRNHPLGRWSFRGSTGGTLNALAVGKHRNNVYVYISIHTCFSCSCCIVQSESLYYYNILHALITDFAGNIRLAAFQYVYIHVLYDMYVLIFKCYISPINRKCVVEDSFVIILYEYNVNL